MYPYTAYFVSRRYITSSVQLNNTFDLSFKSSDSSSKNVCSFSDSDSTDSADPETEDDDVYVVTLTSIINFDISKLKR